MGHWLLSNISSRVVWRFFIVVSNDLGIEIFLYWIFFVHLLLRIICTYWIISLKQVKLSHWVFSMIIQTRILGVVMPILLSIFFCLFFISCCISSVLAIRVYKSFLVSLFIAVWYLSQNSKNFFGSLSSWILMYGCFFKISAMCSTISVWRSHIFV